jgi:hypothetical protein
MFSLKHNASLLWALDQKRRNPPKQVMLCFDPASPDISPIVTMAKVNSREYVDELVGTRLKEWTIYKLPLFTETTGRLYDQRSWQYTYAYTDGTEDHVFMEENTDECDEDYYLTLGRGYVSLNKLIYPIFTGFDSDENEYIVPSHDSNCGHLLYYVRYYPEPLGYRCIMEASHRSFTHVEGDYDKRFLESKQVAKKVVRERRIFSPFELRVLPYMLAPAQRDY